MLVLSRKKNQAVEIGPNIEVTILSVDGEYVKLGLKAPREVSVRRKEPQLCFYRHSQPTTPLKACPMRTDDTSVESYQRIDRDLSHPVVERLRRQLCHNRVLAHYFRRIRLDYDGRALTAEGSVPTFALKSLIESALSCVEGVDTIHDRVNVLSATGLSRVYSAGGKATPFDGLEAAGPRG